MTRCEDCGGEIAPEYVRCIRLSVTHVTCVSTRGFAACVRRE
jgi:hypothetical protein